MPRDGIGGFDCADASAGHHTCQVERVQQEDFDQQDRIVVRARGPLEGSVAIGGAKNSVLKLMAACLLAEGTYVIRNVPDIDDVAVMADVLRAMEVSVSRSGDALTIERPAVINPEAPYSLTEQLRASTAVLGPLLAGAGHARVALARRRRLRPPAHRHAHRRARSHRLSVRDLGGRCTRHRRQPGRQPGSFGVSQCGRHRERDDGCCPGQGHDSD